MPETDYRILESGILPELIPVTGKVWPYALFEPDSVRVSCTVGYGNQAEHVPPEFVAAVQLLVGHYFENREAVLVGVTGADLPMGVKDILMPQVIWF